MKNILTLTLLVFLAGCATAPSTPEINPGQQSLARLEKQTAQPSDEHNKRVCIRNGSSLRDAEIIAADTLRIRQGTRRYVVHLTPGCGLIPSSKFFGVSFSESPGTMVRDPQTGRWRHANERYSNWVCDGRAGQYVVVHESIWVDGHWPKSCKIKGVERAD